MPYFLCLLGVQDEGTVEVDMGFSSVSVLRGAFPLVPPLPFPCVLPGGSLLLRVTLSSQGSEGIEYVLLFLLTSWVGSMYVNG